MQISSQLLVRDSPEGLWTDGLFAHEGRHVAPAQQEHRHHCARQSRDNFSLLRESRRLIHIKSGGEAD